MDVPQFIAGRFRIEREIGTGGMGTVYLATHLGLERPVAVKIIKREFASDADIADRFLREARTMAKLHHPHAAMIFDAGTLPDGRHFIVMEFVEGETLSQRLAREGRFDPARAVEIATQVCDVLEEAHRVGIIHRDLKPSNILLGKRGVCVLDFGVAKVLASSAESTATHASTGSGQLIGTPRYMSPEQCLGQRVGARSDLYSLGVLLYEMLAGRPPFIDPLQSALLVKQATMPAPPLPRLRQDIPRSLALAVHSLLAKRPEDRPRTAASAKALLERSLVRPDRTLPDIQPLSSMVAASTPGNSIMFRVGAPLFLVTVFGALLAWGYTGQSASVVQRIPKEALPVSNAQLQMTPASWQNEATREVAMTTPEEVKQPPIVVAEQLTMDQARKTAAKFATGSIGTIAVLDTDAGSAIVAVDLQRRTGKTCFMLLEKRNGKYRVSAQQPLDGNGFRHATWIAELVDADEDGFQELLFTGKDAEEGRNLRRLVLFVPNDRRAYSMQMTGETTAQGTPKIQWLSNAAGTEAAVYRTVLRQKARAIVSKKKQ
ncbi:MAG TPA: serine/threonine-protein kinase [Pyrinomonadaceae bacterium]|jgi:serine/threonine protein kinase|nr:serine/threonine-protein kinase [Pyrinomonadaceae bacterium]